MQNIEFNKKFNIQTYSLFSVRGNLYLSVHVKVTQTESLPHCQMIVTCPSYGWGGGGARETITARPKAFLKKST